jgi:GDP-4-dehydro-6-deoxy-D-mannose reductase
VKALITGITGFAGSHLADYLLAQGYEVSGTVRWRSQRQNIAHIESQVTLIECDIKDPTSVQRIIDRVRPDHIYHLAAQSYVPTSWHAPAETLVTNLVGQLNVFEAVRELELPARIQIAGSSEEYGMVAQEEMPIKEENALRPLSPYGVSKVAQDVLGYQYHKSYGLDVIRTRAFNHTGPRRGDVFVTSNFCRQVVMIEKGLQEPVVQVGNLDAVRDFSDVRDVVRGYHLALTKGEPGEVYNICSGVGRSMRQLLDEILSHSRVSVETRQDPARMRPSDVPVLIGDAGKFRQATGWAPQIPFDQTISDLLEYWRAQLEARGQKLEATG